MRTASACLFALVMGVGIAACDGLADDSNPGRAFGRLEGRLTGEIPDDIRLQLAIVWRGAPIDEECNPISGAETIVQTVTWSAVDETHFRIELDGPPPAGAVRGEPDEDDADGGDAGVDAGGEVGSDGAIPSRHAEGVLVAYDDRDADGQLDLCHDSTCTDVILGASNPDRPFLDKTVVHEDPLGELGWSRLDAAYPETPRSLLYVEDAWKPYGVREIAAGYAVWRTDADVGAGERFLDAFDPAIDIEVPVVDSPVLDQLSCDGGCEASFAFGAPDCPDLETSWCTFRPEHPPDGVWLVGVRCFLDSNLCAATWRRLTIEGCSRREEEWTSCLLPEGSLPPDGGMYYDPDPDAWDWSCLESP